MPHAVTHVLIPIVILELYRDYFVKNKKTFPLHYVLIGGLAGLIPDLDIAIYYFLQYFGFTFNEVHRVFLHNIFVPLIFLFLALIFYGFKNKKLSEHHLRLRNILLIITFGIIVHFILDGIVVGYLQLFYPFSTSVFGLNIIGGLSGVGRETILGILDAIILVAWLVHIELRHKISRFI